jgi:hypothetical protein
VVRARPPRRRRRRRPPLRRRPGGRWVRRRGRHGAALSSVAASKRARAGCRVVQPREIPDAGVPVAEQHVAAPSGLSSGRSMPATVYQRLSGGSARQWPRTPVTRMRIGTL